jgi:hypothetical protein
MDKLGIRNFSFGDIFKYIIFQHPVAFEITHVCSLLVAHPQQHREAANTERNMTC